jgi:hypothetical protein
LLSDEERNKDLRVGLKSGSTGSDDLILDFTHSKIDSEGFKGLMKVAEEVGLGE